MNPPLGFFFTFRTHGTWLHGDARGAVDDERNVYRTPYPPEDSGRVRRARERMGDEPMIFNAAMRSVVDAAIRNECTFRDREIVELAVRTNHVHAVVLYAHVACEDMSQKLKARATRWLREKRLIGARRRVWADGRGSCNHLWTVQDVADTALYVRDYQDGDRPR